MLIVHWLDLVTNIISRVPIERALFSPRDNTKALEEFIDKQNKSPAGKSASTTIQEPPRAPETQIEAPSKEKPMITTQEEKASSIEAGCIPCAIGHFGTCSGLLNEAVRFAKKDGVGSSEVIDRVNMCLDELNAMERVDLRPEMIIDLPDWEKELANRSLTASRSTRHGLEGLTTGDDLEKVAANTQKARAEIGRKWFKERLARMPKEEKAKLAEKAIEKLEEE